MTLSTCSGLRGLLQLENVSYGIEPVDSTAAYEHMLYQINNDKIDFSLLHKNPMPQLVQKSYKILVKSEKDSDILLKRILKIQIIMDKALFDYMGSEVAVAAEKVVHIFGLVNTMFSQLKVTVKLTSLELWSDQNMISTNADADEVLQRFVSWKEQFLFQRSHDLAYLLIAKNMKNAVILKIVLCLNLQSVALDHAVKKILVRYPPKELYVGKVKIPVIFQNFVMEYMRIAYLMCNLLI